MLSLGLNLWRPVYSGAAPPSPGGIELREDGSNELREDGSIELRE